MKKLAFIPILLLLLIQPSQLRAQELFINADLVSSFLWRGIKYNDACLQPSMGIRGGGLQFMVWGSTDFNTYGSHVDLFLSYKLKNFRFEVADYFVLNNPDDSFNYFDYKANTTNHMFEANVTYTVDPKRFPLAIKWSTFFAGTDFYDSEDPGKRSYSSYLEFGYPFSYQNFDFRAEVGMTFWDGLYADKTNVVNLGLSMGKKVRITDKITIPVSGKLIFNPYLQKSHFVFAINL
ncbi:hypothetical protein [Bacteroides sp. 51]|uniref:hypothetical protein n=1 Tax=Bacteroides sp. 51 TaxID=2302938 RepID=UPI0013D89199|nr:hypothetical protein [Bacteroides sp. 51]NDV80372.1 hypothetical protein [Bacteroides sp. 51]